MPGGEVLELYSLNNIWILYTVQRKMIDMDTWFIGSLINYGYT